MRMRYVTCFRNKFHFVFLWEISKKMKFTGFAIGYHSGNAYPNLS